MFGLSMCGNHWELWLAAGMIYCGLLALDWFLLGLGSYFARHHQCSKMYELKEDTESDMTASIVLLRHLMYEASFRLPAQ